MVMVRLEKITENQCCFELKKIKKIKKKVCIQNNKKNLKMNERRRKKKPI